MRVAVCDDEKEVRELMLRKIRRICPLEEVCSYSSGEEVLADSVMPDILLLDIQMPGIDGMETARELRRRSKAMILIFVTVVEEYVFRAFDVGAFHYLVKPFADEKLEEVFNKARLQYEEQKTALAKEPKDNCIMIKKGGAYFKVLLDDIIYAEIFDRKIVIHKKNEDIEYYGRMSKLAQQAGEDFFRPHRAYLVHFKYIAGYNSSRIRMEGGGAALMAKQNYPEFVKSYLRYNHRQESGQ